MIFIGFKAFVPYVFHKLGPLACSADWFLNGVSWYKELKIIKIPGKMHNKGVIPSGVS